jgi:hypothetical protein
MNAAFLESYWNASSPVEQSRYFGDFVASTKPIGLVRTGLNPEVVKTSFEASDPNDAQFGFQVQVGAPSGSDIVWDFAVRAGSGNRVTVDERRAFRGALSGQRQLEPDTSYAARVRSGAWSGWSPRRTVIQTAPRRLNL